MITKLKKWNINYLSENSLVSYYMQKYECFPLLAKVLVSKFGDDFEKADSFLTPKLSNLQDPFKIKDCKKAAEKIYFAVKNKQKICIYGDFDMDGISATALLYEFLQAIGADVISYIPDRMDEGYGLNIKALDYLIAQKNVDLFVTVDCGVNSVEEVDFLNKKGVEIIITDHHHPLDILPNAYAVVNPKVEGNPDVFGDLAGVGVAFEVAYAILKIFKQKEGIIPFDLKKSLDLVALGTVADIVPLTGENRILVSKGIEVLKNTNRIGLKFLYDVAGIDNLDKIGAYHIAFLLAPRFNSSGRLGDAKKGFDLLTNVDSDTVSSIANELDTFNKRRRSIEDKIFVEAEKKFMSFKEDKIIVLEDESWHIGVIGIVASKLAEKWGKPFLLIGNEKGVMRGSGRSFGDFDLMSAFEEVKEVFETFGGHKSACGFTIKKENIGLLREKLNDYADNISDEFFVKTLEIDCVVDLEDIFYDSVKELGLLAPFGYGNRKPVFLVKNALIKDSYVRKGKHFFINAERGGKVYNFVWFSAPEILLKNSDKFKGGKADIVFSAILDNYRGGRNVTLKIEDIDIN